MPGVKGRSGRKSKREEIQSNELKELSIKTCREYLNSDASLERRVEIAKHFALKAMPNKIEGEGFGDNITNLYNIIREIRQAQAVDTPSVELDSGHSLHAGRTRPATPNQTISAEGVSGENL